MLLWMHLVNGSGLDTCEELEESLQTLTQKLGLGPDVMVRVLCGGGREGWKKGARPRLRWTMKKRQDLG